MVCCRLIANAKRPLESIEIICCGFMRLVFWSFGYTDLDRVDGCPGCVCSSRRTHFGQSHYQLERAINARLHDAVMMRRFTSCSITLASVLDRYSGRSAWPRVTPTSADVRHPHESVAHCCGTAPRAQRMCARAHTLSQPSSFYAAQRV